MKVLIFFLFLLYITFAQTDVQADTQADTQDNRLLREAIEANDIGRVKTLLSKDNSNVNSPGDGKANPVELAIIMGNVEIAKVLIGAGGDAEVLHEVTIKILLSMGADEKALRSLKKEHFASLHAEVMKAIRGQINAGKVEENSNVIDFNHQLRFRNACQIIFDQ